MANTARPLAAERPWLKLARDDAERRIADAIATLDARIAAPPPHELARSPVQVGTLEHFPCQYEDGYVGWRYHNVGGRDFAVRLPHEMDTDETDAAVRHFMTELLAIQHRRDSGR